MDDRAQRLKALASLRAGIRASEEWAPSYKKDRKVFKQLVALEAGLQTDVGEYLFALSSRASQYVDWQQYVDKLSKQAVTASIHAHELANATDPVWKGEALSLQRAIIDAITSITELGVDSALSRYGLPLRVDSVSDFVARAAQNHVAQLVSGVTDTTRDKIRLALEQSLTRSESVSDATARIQQVINNPVRAEMIAQTESVNSYALGQESYAKETGAKGKTWEALAGACNICAPLDGMTVGIDEPFTLEDGTEVERPAAHPRCRCAVYFEY